jgi:quercetin dioxygenase-like cupin family protein
MRRIVSLSVFAFVVILTSTTMVRSQAVGLNGLYNASYPFNVASGDYNLINLGLDIAPGGKIPRHIHSGPAVVSVLSGEVTLIQADGTEKTLKAGESFMENPNVPHAVENRSGDVVRFAVTQLIPKGAASTTYVK